MDHLLSKESGRPQSLPTVKPSERTEPTDQDQLRKRPVSGDSLEGHGPRLNDAAPFFWYNNTAMNDMDIAARVVAAMAAKGKTCATAESCTGGGVGFAITSVAGSSAVYLGGVVSYSNSVKASLLGVSTETLASVGAVSSEVAGQMAAGARRVTGADFAVSLTGIAGPGGGSAEKPVGLVWFGLATPDGVETESRVFSGDRAQVRAAAVEHALGLLLAAVER